MAFAIWPLQMSINYIKYTRFLLLISLTVIFACEQNPSQSEIYEQIVVQLSENPQDSLLRRAYSEHNDKPLWVARGGFQRSGQQYWDALEDVAFDGLEVKDYKPDSLTDMIQQAKEATDPSLLATLDISISRSFLNLANDLHVGRIHPDQLDIEWEMDLKEPTEDYLDLMLAVANGKSAAKAFTQLRPENAQYEGLRQQLKKLLEQNENSAETIPSFSGKIEVGQKHTAITAIRKKLAFWGFGDSEPTDNDVYTEALEKQVKAYQRKHGLNEDGVIGQGFLEVVNYSLEDLITKTKVNLERWRWLPDYTDSDRNKVIVNIPDFQLFYLQGEDTVLVSKVVVGKEYRQTPVFKSKMTYMVFSPTWTLPETILWEDAIPSIQNDPDYLVKNEMKLLDFQGNEVNYEKVKWNKIEGKSDFPYMIRQSPGTKNPLGQVKFMFPNDYSIYIHDSPAKALFSREERMFSSGCIRMEKPRELATLLLEDMEEWDELKIDSSMNLQNEQNVKLKHAQDVWILYLSVWEQSGQLAIREDIYDMDKKVAKAMGLPVSGNFL
jgi:L,D-transpeptidase YcbB